VAVTTQAQMCNHVANSISSYFAHVERVTVASTGQRSFGTDTRGTIHFKNSGAAIAAGMAGASVLPVVQPSPVEHRPDARAVGLDRRRRSSRARGRLMNCRTLASRLDVDGIGNEPGAIVELLLVVALVVAFIAAVAIVVLWPELKD
jgi:hypothetical protein